MGLQARYRGPADERKHTLAAAAKGGDVVQTADGYAGVISGTGDFASGDVVTATVKGVFELDCASGTTLSAGAVVQWDDTNNLVVASGTFRLGTLVKAKTSGQLTAWVSLNDTPAIVDT